MNERLYQLPFPLFAITGSIGTGKSTATAQIKKRGHPCLEADQLIKNIYQTQETREFIAKLSPHFICNQQVDFNQLKAAFFNDPKIKTAVQSHLYEKLPSEFFIEVAKLGHIRYLFYDIPLLFEHSLEQHFDLIITIYCPLPTQIERIVQRDKVSPKMAQKIISHQVDIEQKKLLADYVLDNTTTTQALRQKVDQLLEQLQQSTQLG